MTTLLPISVKRLDVWPRNMTATDWIVRRREIESTALSLLGRFPEERCALTPEVLDESAAPGYIRRHIRFRSEPDDWIYAYLLIPDRLQAPASAVIAIHGSVVTGKDCTVGLTGLRPKDAPDRNRAYALDAVECGCVTLAPDMDTIGERAPDGRVWDTRPFYQRHPEWSAMGKVAWDISRCVDYLETLSEVDARRIACMGHCYGGYATMFGAAFEPRIRCALTNSGIWTFRSGRSAWARDPDDPTAQAQVRKYHGERAGVYVHIPKLAEYVGYGQDNLLKPLPLDYHDIACLIPPRALYSSNPLEGRPADFSDTKERDLRVTRETTGKFLGGLESLYDTFHAADRFESWVYASDHTWSPEAKERALLFMRRVFAN